MLRGPAGCHPGATHLNTIQPLALHAQLLLAQIHDALASHYGPITRGGLHERATMYGKKSDKNYDHVSSLPRVVDANT